MNDEQLAELLQQAPDDGEDENGELEMPAALHAYQLLCFESYAIHVGSCSCHSLQLTRLGLSACHTAPSDLATYVWARLQDDFNVAGLYFVAMWACPAFRDFSPVFMSRAVGRNEDVLGMTIHVGDAARLAFLIAVSRMGEAGASPCLYMRKMDIDVEEQVVHMFTDDWFSEFANLLYYWQAAEWRFINEQK